MNTFFQYKEIPCLEIDNTNEEKNADEAGWIKRKKNPEDKRGFVISAVSSTDTNNSLQAASDGLASEDKMFACLDSGEQEQVKTILVKLIESLRNEATASAPQQVSAQPQTPPPWTRSFSG